MWFFQAALFDLSANPHTDSFQICQRVFNQCQRLLYDDPLADTDLVASHSGSSVALGSSLRRRLRIKARSKKGDKILPSNVLSCFVGMGAVVASVPGMPRLAAFSGQAAIEQGRRKPQGRDRPPLEGSGMQRVTMGEEDSNGSDDAGADSGDESENDGEDVDASETETGTRANIARESTSREGRTAPAGKRADDEGGEVTAIAAKAPPFSTSAGNTAGNKQQTASTSAVRIPPVRSNSKDLSNSLMQFTSGFNDLRDKAAAAVNDVFGQKFGVDFAPGTQTADAPAPPLWYRQHRRRESGARNKSVVSVSRRSSMADTLGSRVGTASLSNLVGRNSLSNSPYGSSATLGEDPSIMTPETVLARYDGEARRRLLRSNYCRKQTQFLQTLQDISARLLLLPKPARLSALRAELTELNHSLPAEVCFPLWCEAAAQEGQETSDAMDRRSPMPRRSKRGRHHRVVRINPSESVVLNSADRAPYLLHVEVLSDDLDFDPDRKQNRESLKKLVMQEDIRRRKTLMTRQFSASGGQMTPATVPADGSGSTTHGTDEPKADGAHLKAIVRENVGAELTRRGTSPPLVLQQPQSPTPVIDEEPSGDGEEIDLTEQAYGSDLAAFGGERAESEESDGDDLAAVNLDHDHAAWSRTLPGRTPGNSLTRLESAQLAASKKKEFSLDEYAERMRTAAIMLAQLNQSTNASAQPIVASNPHVSSTAQGGWSSWIMGTSWAATSNGTRSEAGQGSAGVKASVAASNGSAGSAVSASASDSLGAGAGILGPAYAARGSGTRLMHTDTEMIRKRIMQEMMALEEERMERMKLAGSNRKSRRGTTVEDEATVQRAVNKDDPSAAMFRESWATKKARIRASSPYGHLETWDVFSVIVKTGADLRQEQLAIQLIQEFARIWGETSSRCWVRYFRILVTSENSGIMETITDSVSVHSIKKEAYSRQQQKLALQEQYGAADGGKIHMQGPPAKIATYSLLDHFIDTYGDPSSAKFGKARQRFIESLAGYSIISYLLQIKDRHNGNILIDNEGHLIRAYKCFQSSLCKVSDPRFQISISASCLASRRAAWALKQHRSRLRKSTSM